MRIGASGRDPFRRLRRNAPRRRGELTHRSCSRAGLGGGTVEGCPEAADSVPAGFLYNGALSTYDGLGFIRDRKIGKHRWVVTKVVQPSQE